jgi:hypothetical protein
MDKTQKTTFFKTFFDYAERPIITNTINKTMMMILNQL